MNKKAFHSPLPNPVPGPNERKILAAIIVLGFLLRVGLCFLTSLPHMHKDSFEYYRQADALLAGGYINYFPNGYPFIIALAKAVSGIHADLLLIWLNILLSTATLWFVYDIGKRVFGHVSVGLLAAGVLAIFPSQINWVRWLMTEVPTAFFLLGAFYFYYREQYGWSGLFFGLATLVRTNVAPVFLLLVILELIYREKGSGGLWASKKLRIPAKIIAGAMAPLLLVGAYCDMKTGSFSVSGNNQINILYAVTASGSDIDFHLGNKRPDINTSGKALKMYVDHMKEQPLEFLKQKLANLWELWGFYASAANGGRGTLSRITLGAGNFFMIVFGLAGWWMNRKDLTISVLLLPFLVVTFLHTLLFAMPRYTYPVEAFMILLACATLYAWAKKKRLPPNGTTSTALSDR